VLETVGAGLRPLTTTAIVDAAIEHVRDDPVLYYGIVAPVVLPLVALGLYFVDLVNDYRGDPAEYTPRVLAAAAVLTVLLHLRFVAEGALAWALERRLRGVEATAAGAWRAALPRALPLAFGGALLWWLAFFLSFMLVVPAVIPFALLCLSPAIVMSEGTGPFATVRRAASLGWLEIGRAVAIALMLILGTVALAAGTALGVVALLELVRTILYADLSWLEAVLSLKNPRFAFGALLAGLALLEPVKTLAFALLYVDRRVRTEGFDLKRKVQLILEREKPVPTEVEGPPVEAAS
jgi:hypothetical protein